MVISYPQFEIQLAAFLWSLFRIAAALSVMPVFANRAVPPRARVLLALGLTAMLYPLLFPLSPALAQVPMLSGPGLLITVQQLGLGLAMGFVFNLVWAAFVHGGQIIAMQMGLGFASMIDPANGVAVPVVSQFYVILITLLFLAMGGHLAVITLLVESFRMLPVGEAGLSAATFHDVAAWASVMFAGSVLIALPAVSALLLTNIAFGVVTRAAPQLNIFAVGFPVTMMLGFVIMLATVGVVAEQFHMLFLEALQQARNVFAR